MSLLTRVPDPAEIVDDVAEDDAILLMLQTMEPRLAAIEDRMAKQESAMAGCMAKMAADEADDAKDKAEEAQEKAEEAAERAMLKQMLADEREEHATTRTFISGIQQEMAKLVKAMVASNAEDAKEDKSEAKQLTLRVSARDGNGRISKIEMQR